jgi:hypothetical protein
MAIIAVNPHSAYLAESERGFFMPEQKIPLITNQAAPVLLIVSKSLISLKNRLVNT